MKRLRVALVHDYLGEFGGAERVLEVLAEMFPDAPIYTAFFRKGEAYERLKHRDIRVSWAHRIPFFSTKLHSPLRFLASLIWESFDFKGYDLVISSASWYITKGILTGPETVHISYIHTPPRYLYGYETSIDWQKYWPLRLYARVVNNFLREYDFVSAQRPDVLIANSENVRRRIQKFYRRDAIVVYPPVELPLNSTTVFSRVASRGISLSGHPIPPSLVNSNKMVTDDQFPRKKIIEFSSRDYFLVVSRVVGGKGLELAVKACSELGLPLKIVGEAAGWSSEYKKIRQNASSSVEFLGFVSDEKLIKLYSGAKAFLATARDEDFGMTVVEAQLCGTPVIAYRGGGYLETVVEGKTGIFFDDYSVRGLKKAINQFSIQYSVFSIPEIKKHAQKFSKDRFVKDIRKVIEKTINKMP
ncbi:glycosyltransferase [Candidatus Collierbacteria bacterium]|nr:glycosyltransferase [Candidatus Collierbacteria bacterium]